MSITSTKFITPMEKQMKSLKVILAVSILTLSSASLAEDSVIEDDTVLRSMGAEEITAPFSDNCGDKKKSLKKKFDKCRFATCWSPEKNIAELLGVELGAELVRDGYNKKLTVGSKKIKHWSGPVTWPNTYMGYACANK